MKTELGIRDLIVMYVGNLEEYQGIDLLLESFALVAKKTQRADLVIIGGEVADIQKYQRKSGRLGIENRVHFLGPKPVQQLSQYLSEADILVSPRLKGNNTPMKLYSYLHSAKAVLATNLPTHTQVIDNRVAMLGDPHIESFSKAMLRLIEDHKLRADLGIAGKKLVEEKFSYNAYREKLNGLFDWLQRELQRNASLRSKASH